MKKVLQNCPWFINNHLLSIQRWTPNFIPEKATLTYSVVWVRLPQLPIEFYDGILLKEIENSIGKLLKIDSYTSSTLRGRCMYRKAQTTPSSFQDDTNGKKGTEEWKMVKFAKKYCKFRGITVIH
ncbi:hypothetical protein H5410_015748 [Solanum commersonii]|uniref:DUF4283 domain-containing protein n=1 Tax=Solanum commersonii TaxID=4109 RepID=A0A9J5ZVC0_SOLCO|nr:hypothetical protein H5410_015748 [Solanum commersonii]